MQLYSIRGGTREHLENKMYQIGVGVSMGNKWFSIENTSELVKWALQNTKDLVIIYVADSIHAINIEVRKKVSNKKAIEIADKMGNEFLADIKNYLIQNLNEQEFLKIRFAKWKDLVDDKYQEKVDFLYSFYNNNAEFRQDIINIVKDFTSSEPKSFSESDILRFGDYIIEELPECMTRVKIAGYDCDAWVYPNADGPLVQFIYGLIEGKIFPEVKEKLMDTEPKVLLEVR